MFTSNWWLGDDGALTRSIRTFAQGVLATIGYSAMPFNAFTADWKSAIGIGLGAALVSLLMSLDRREALLTPPPIQTPAVKPAPLPPLPPSTVNDPAAADYQPTP